MALTWTENLLLTILLGLLNDVWGLPAPVSTSMDSVNMRHTLRWAPLQAPCNATVLYSVQYQGEFELWVGNGSWVDAADCQQIPHTHCDLTFDLGSDSDYNLQVRAQCDRQLSAWTRLSQPFNRRDTVLTVPEMTVTAIGNSLQVMFRELPLTGVVSVIVWKKGAKLQTAVYSMPAEQTVFAVTDLQEGATYCVRAQLVLNSALHSNSTELHCVPVAGAESAAWKTPTAVTVAVFLTAGVLFALFWAIAHCSADACQQLFQKEPLPQSLKVDLDRKTPAVAEEEEELMEEVIVVLKEKKNMASL
ncbi:interleukin-20 receptor subunit beta [Salarias fasciatus]|uniref:interleukin-20 receptor subunit beta n=1 Tax=Salarias fasciatus TaxID=181472 RepID=UPI0011766C85|nr:interleukin-20 receptor subunit beta [Salarias fasciatus]